MAVIVSVPVHVGETQVPTMLRVPLLLIEKANGIVEVDEEVETLDEDEDDEEVDDVVVEVTMIAATLMLRLNVADAVAPESVPVTVTILLLEIHAVPSEPTVMGRVMLHVGVGVHPNGTE